MESLTSTLIDDAVFSNTDKFTLLKNISQSKDIDDLAILVAMRLSSHEWDGYEQIAVDLVRSAGLFPYLDDSDQDGLSLRNMLARHYFQSPSGRLKFMHRAQYAALSKLLSGESVILSAPTSFGKTFIVDELLLSGKYNNVLIVVPTIALIEELRKHMKAIDLPHKRISFASEAYAEKNVFILTQERAHEMLGAIREQLGELDLLVIDEFYKMDKQLLSKEEKNNGDRADLLSVVYREYSGISKQVYLLGPHLQGANGYDTTRHKPTWIEYHNNTTYLEFIRMKASRASDRGVITREIIQVESDDIMVYCSSPDQTKNLYRDHLQDIFEVNHLNDDFIGWIEEHVTGDWYVVEALRRGIGIHHGRLPRFISQEMIRRFSDGRIRVLLCTSTIIEGVNTNAKTVVIYNNKQAFNAGYLTFKNIAGRAGRMFKHFYGKVYHFEMPPKDELIEVNDPIGTESGASTSLLNLLEDEHLSTGQKKDVQEHRSNTRIPLELQRLNHFIPIDRQEAVVALIQAEGSFGVVARIHSPDLSRAEIIAVYALVTELGYNIASQVRAGDNVKGCYRASVLTQAYFSDGIAELARSMNQERQVNDETIEQALTFARNVMGYSLPKYIRALERLYSYSLGGTRTGTLEPFANRLEFLNTEPVYMQLDELGLPVEFSKAYRLPTETIDAAAQFTVRLLPELKGFDLYIATNFVDSY